MSKENTKVVHTGMGLSSILTIIFVVAKLFGIINWSWWLVFLPTIISVGLGLLVVIIALIIVAFLD